MKKIPDIVLERDVKHDQAPAKAASHYYKYDPDLSTEQKILHQTAKIGDKVTGFFDELNRFENGVIIRICKEILPYSFRIRINHIQKILWTNEIYPPE